MIVNFKNKKILVTGSSKGIGLGISKTLINEGNKVILTGSNIENINKARRILGSKRAFYFCSDLTVSKNIDKLTEYTKSKFNNLDLLVCNLGSGKYISPNKNDILEWKKLFEINFWSAFETINKSVNLLKKNKGSIICISSIVGSYNISGAPLAYSCAKSVLNKFVKSSVVNFSKFGIRINIISPGNILFKGSTWDKKLKENRSITKKYIKNNVPLNKFGQIDDITSMIIYLASDNAKFITGSEFIIDGGQTKL